MKTRRQSSKEIVLERHAIVRELVREAKKWLVDAKIYAKGGNYGIAHDAKRHARTYVAAAQIVDMRNPAALQILISSGERPSIRLVKVR